jgi:hypothetical protein
VEDDDFASYLRVFYSTVGNSVTALASQARHCSTIVQLNHCRLTMVWLGHYRTIIVQFLCYIHAGGISYLFRGAERCGTRWRRTHMEGCYQYEQSEGAREIPEERRDHIKVSILPSPTFVA